MATTTRARPAKASKSYKVVKPKTSRRHTTQTTKNHRFQSFNERIANLKIDPIRRKRHVDAQEQGGEETHTHFGQSLEEWRDSNLSRTFTAFAKDAAPLCDNLAVVLYNEDKIMNLLVKYIELADALAMEPLLSLLSHFAHDLDTRFEKHFQRAVATVTAVAAKHQDLAVVEWSFTSLAWLFKYLSRLLVPDLRPLYNLMAPYLGKEQQRAFIVRFSAEALSFLVKKAAVTYARDSAPLDTITEHVTRDYVTSMETAIADLHQQGIMTMFTEAIKGVQNGLNTSGVAVLQSLLHTAGTLMPHGQAVTTLVCGNMTSMVHHCTTETFRPVHDIITAYVMQVDMSSRPDIVAFCSQLLFTIISVRKGTRITEWKSVMGAVQRLFDAADHLDSVHDSGMSNLLGLLAVSVQTAPIGAALTLAQSLKRFDHERWEPYFLRFCDLFLRLGTDRFKDILAPHFKKYAMRQTMSNEELLYRLIPKVAACNKTAKLDVNAALIDALLDELAQTNDEGSAEKSQLGALSSKLAAVPDIAFSDKQSIRLRGSLTEAVKSSLPESQSGDQTLRDFRLGTCFQHLLKIAEDQSTLSEIWTPLCAVSPSMTGLPIFWSNLLQYIKQIRPTTFVGPHIDTLEDALIACLSMPSHTMRQDVLDIFSELYRLKEIGQDALATAIRIESTPISLDTSRSISMNIRRLAQEYAPDQDAALAKAIPSYCFGLLHMSLAQAWDDAINSLAVISQSKQGEEVVMSLVQSWLEGTFEAEDGAEPAVLLDINSDGFKVLSDFECPNLAKLNAIRDQALEEPQNVVSPVKNTLFNLPRRISPFTATTRSQALKVLQKVPRLAEKRSRLLVPTLLQWAGRDIDEDDSRATRWQRKDQKAMLSIFAQFVNPRVLYKSEEVHQALLQLCANGDVEIQQSALKAILAWKDSVLTRYEEHLNNLLDEARFREEISVFLRDRTEEDEDEGIAPDDHAQLMPVLLRLIYGRAVAGGKGGQADRRKAIFVALSRFGEGTLKHFLDIALPNTANVYAQGLENQIVIPTAAPLRQQLGMLNLVNDMILVLGAELESFVDRLLKHILSSTVHASQKLNHIEESNDASLLRDIRQTGMQCLVKVFTQMSNFESEAYMDIILQDLFAPRLSTFAIENTQSVSASLRLLAAWSSNTTTATLFLQKGSEVLKETVNLLRNEHARPQVQMFVLQEIVDKLAMIDTTRIMLQPHVSSIVQAVGVVIRRQPSKDVLDACVKSFSQIADQISSGEEAADVTKICTDLLVKPGRSVSATTKTRLLRTLLPLLEHFEIEAKDDLYTALCALFSRLNGAESRQLLSHVLASLVRNDGPATESARVCEDMNALGSRLDEPDHERRERAFTWIYEHYQTMSLQQWQPIIHNCLFYIRDREDRVNRTSASHALQRLVDAATVSTARDVWLPVLENTILAGVERGMKENSELVRAEYLAVVGHIVKAFPEWARVSDMQALTVSGDDEASFFANILHIQQHRRLRALKRLADDSDMLASDNASRLFLPLLEHFVYDQADGDSGRTLADQTVQTIGIVSRKLNRQAFRGAFQQYIGYLKAKPDLEKTTLRLLGVMVDGLDRSDTRVTPAIINEQLPPLLEYLHLKDESTVDRRMPVAVTIVKLMLALPEAELASRLPAVLTDVSHVLRSKSQEARDQTRKALTAISRLIGAQYFRFILKELRSALKRGSQLHVLSYTVHSLLVDTNFSPGDLDECLPELMLVIMDDTFGVTGQEKDAEEYKSGMKEVKSSKSFDTLELLARVTPINKLGELIRPVRALLSEKLDIKMVKKLDELLTRLRKGLDQNPASEDRDMLKFCWEIVSQVRAENSKSPKEETNIDERVRRFLVLPEAPKHSHARGATTSYSFKLMSFALNLLRKVVRRHEDLQTAQNMAGFLPMAGDALLESQEEVKLSALRFLSTIMRVPLPQLEADAPIYVKESVALVKGAPIMTTDAVKASLELITSILREKRSVVIKEKDVAFLLKRVKADLDEPDRQGMIFRFLRAVLGRKIVITEVYEVMDEVGKAMVTNPDASVRESARSAYLQFVMEYPQGKDRWQKQTAFLVGNLQYEHASGRKSVMEFLHQMLGKVGEEVMAETSPRIFVSLLLVLVSDSDNHCREMAKLLVGRLFERAEDAQRKHFLSMMQTWLRKDKKASVKRGALQCWAILMQTREVSKSLLESLRDKLEEILVAGDEDDSEPELLLDALHAFSVLVKTAPGIAFAGEAADLWESLRTLPLFDDNDIQNSVASLLGSLFDNFAAVSSKNKDGLGGLPLRGSGGLELGVEDMRRFCTVNLDALHQISLSTSPELTQYLTYNLRFLGRCFDANGIPWDNEEAGATSDEEHETSEDQISALAHLLRELSRTITTDSHSVIARTAALECESALIRQLTNPIPNVQTVLRPLYALTDPSVPKPPGELHKALEDKAHEAMELIQKKLGPEAYVTALAETRKKAKEVRDERRQKRKIGAIAHPEKWEKTKKRKHEVKKSKIKERGAEARGKRRGW